MEPTRTSLCNDDHNTRSKRSVGVWGLLEARERSRGSLVRSLDNDLENRLKQGDEGGFYFKGVGQTGSQKTYHDIRNVDQMKLVTNWVAKDLSGVYHVSGFRFPRALGLAPNLDQWYCCKRPKILTQIALGLRAT